MQEPQVSAVTAALKADALGDHGTLQRPLQVRVFFQCNGTERDWRPGQLHMARTSSCHCEPNLRWGP